MNQPLLLLCIPRIELKTQKEFIVNTIKKLNIGNIENIKELPLRSDKKYKRVFLSLRLINTENSIFLKDKIENNESIKLIYDMPWYWKIQEART